MEKENIKIQVHNNHALPLQKNPFKVTFKATDLAPRLVYP